ncbi:MAG TPA: hypothetical protein VN241_02625 [Microbacterium sp.]|nr:hypothetical protein [Microbacterium sp.]
MTDRTPRDDDRDPVTERTTAYDSSGSHVDETRPPVSDRAVREEVVAREKEQFGGMKFGTAFFGWLTATGTVALLSALISGTGAALGLGVEDAADAAGAQPETIGLIGAIGLLLVLLIGYFAGGYVAGRMARFSGAKQGVAVWLWAVIIAIVGAILVAIVGAQFNPLADINAFPRIPINEGALTVTAIVTVVIAALVTLLGAVLGGLAGMRFHRRVDRAGLGG